MGKVLKWIAIIWISSGIITLFLPDDFGEPEVQTLEISKPSNTNNTISSKPASTKNTSSSKTRKVKRGETPVLRHDIGLVNSKWQTKCKNPDDAKTCFLVYRSKYRLPTGLDQKNIEHAFSIWMGYSSNSNSPMISISMEWFDEEVTIIDKKGIIAENVDGYYETISAAKEVKQNINWFKADQCLFMPKINQFPRGSVSCRFMSNVKPMSEKLGYPPNWNNDKSLSFTVVATDKKSYQSKGDIHEFHFRVPVKDGLFVPYHASVMPPLLKSAVEQQTVQSKSKQVVKTKTPEQLRLEAELQAKMKAQQEIDKKLAAVSGPGFDETTTYLNNTFREKWRNVCFGERFSTIGFNNLYCETVSLSFYSNCEASISRTKTEYYYSDATNDKYDKSYTEIIKDTYTIKNFGFIDSNIKWYRGRATYPTAIWKISDNGRYAIIRNYDAVDVKYGHQFLTFKSLRGGKILRSTSYSKDSWLPPADYSNKKYDSRKEKNISENKFVLEIYLPGQLGSKLNSALSQYERLCKIKYPDAPDVF